MGVRMKQQLAKVKSRFYRWAVKNPYLAYRIETIVLFMGAAVTGFAVALLLSYGRPNDETLGWAFAGFGLGTVMGPIKWLYIAVLIRELEDERQQLEEWRVQNSLRNLEELEARYASLSKKERQILLKRWVVSE